MKVHMPWAAALSLLVAAAPGQAVNLAALDTRLVASGLVEPLFAAAPLANGRLFVVEKGGAIRLFEGGVASSFLSLGVVTAGEQGLLGLAFDPGFGDNSSAGYGRFFVNYIEPVTRDTVIASYRTQADGRSADLSTRQEVLRIDQPNGLSNHKAGWLGFKPGDGDHLYIAVGDGGGSNDPSNNGQNRNTLLGKMLRIDINGDDFADPNLNYAIPDDNPFAGQAGARGEIFSYGLRNPFRNGFDSATGNLWIADVGQGQREELNFIAAASPGGQNFGWRLREGDIATPGVGGPPPADNVEPMLVYDHSVGASITGGHVVRDPGSPLDGTYVFADFITARVWSIAADGSPQSLADATELTDALNAGAAGPLGNISSFGFGAGGELYIVDYANGTVVQVVPEPGTLLMWGAGLAALLAVRTRQRRLRSD
jgi:glucose/arabinose dehydrogenase